MSPRHRGRGRRGGGPGGPGGAAGVVTPNGQGSGAGLETAGEGTEPVEAPADEGATGSGNGLAPLQGSRPNDAAGGSAGGPSGGGGGFGGGQPGGQRRQPRGRPTGRASGPRPAPVSALASAPAPATPAPAIEVDEDGNPVPGRRPNCTLAQMRRFIKSRPYVPVHELRRRFEIEGIEDEVSPVATEHGTIYVGLPPEQAQFLGDLIRSGDVGCEMLLDPDSPGVIGVFPMRPIARQ